MSVSRHHRLCYQNQPEFNSSHLQFFPNDEFLLILEDFLTDKSRILLFNKLTNKWLKPFCIQKKFDWELKPSDLQVLGFIGPRSFVLLANMTKSSGNGIRSLEVNLLYVTISSDLVEMTLNRTVHLLSLPNVCKACTVRALFRPSGPWYIYKSFDGASRLYEVDEPWLDADEVCAVRRPSESDDYATVYGDFVCIVHNRKQNLILNIYDTKRREQQKPQELPNAHSGNHVMYGAHDRWLVSFCRTHAQIYDLAHATQPPRLLHLGACLGSYRFQRGFVLSDGAMLVSLGVGAGGDERAMRICAVGVLTPPRLSKVAVSVIHSCVPKETAKRMNHLRVKSTQDLVRFLLYGSPRRSQRKDVLSSCCSVS